MNIVLIGFMGAGKSTLAPLLAQKLHLELIEMDKLIEEKAGKSSEKIFAEGGETLFREYEIAVAKDIRNKKNVIISTGGGVVMNKIILDYLRENGSIIHLAASFKTIVERINPRMPRPLFEDIAKAKALYKLRAPLYKHYAHFKINTDDRTPEEIANVIIGKMKTK